MKHAFRLKSTTKKKKSVLQGEILLGEIFQVKLHKEECFSNSRRSMNEICFALFSVFRLLSRVFKISASCCSLSLQGKLGADPNLDEVSTSSSSSRGTSVLVFVFDMTKVGMWRRYYTQEKNEV